MDFQKSSQAILMPFIALLTALLWAEAWMEILSRGTLHSPDNLSKIYLTMMGAYAGATEIHKWLLHEPHDPADDHGLERVQRGGFFVALWLIPLLTAYIWRIINPARPMPVPVMQITTGLIVIFFAKATSRHVRHKNKGVGGADVEITVENDLAQAVHSKISESQEGMSPSDLKSAFPDAHPKALYRTLNKLVSKRKLKRIGKPRTPDVKYHATSALLERGLAPTKNGSRGVASAAATQLKEETT